MKGALMYKQEEKKDILIVPPEHPHKKGTSAAIPEWNASEEGKETIIYRRVETRDMNGKNTKGLKGPAYKNYKP